MHEKVSQGYSRDKKYKELFPSKKPVTTSKNELILFLKYIGLHGFLLNYTAFILIGMPLLPWTIPAYGLAWWYLKEELTKIVYELTARR